MWALSVAAVRNPTEFESRLARYLYERSEEGRAVRVGEKELSEQTEIVKRYADLGQAATRAFESYVEEVRGGAFPTEAHSFGAVPPSPRRSQRKMAS